MGRKQKKLSFKVLSTTDLKTSMDNARKNGPACAAASSKLRSAFKNNKNLRDHGTREMAKFIRERTKKTQVTRTPASAKQKTDAIKQLNSADYKIILDFSGDSRALLEMMNRRDRIIEYMQEKFREVERTSTSIEMLLQRIDILERQIADSKTLGAFYRIYRPSEECNTVSGAYDVSGGFKQNFMD